MAFSIINNNMAKKTVATQPTPVAQTDPRQEPTAAQTAAQAAAQDTAYLFARMPQAEQKVVLENEFLAVTFSNKGAQPVSAQLKGHKAYTGEPLYLFKEGDASLSFPLRTNTQRFLETSEVCYQVVSAGPEAVTFRLPFAQGQYMDIAYTLPKGSHMLGIHVDLSRIASLLPANLNAYDVEWNLNMPRQEQAWKFENQYATAYYKYPGNDVEKLKPTKKSQEKSINESVKWISYTDKYFATVLIAQKENRLENNNLSFTTHDEHAAYVKDFKYSGTYRLSKEGGGTADFSLFMGPLDYKLLKSYDREAADEDKLELNRMVYLGAWLFRWINVNLIMPIVGLLEGGIANWGIIILLLTLIIKLVLSPLTFKSYMSQAKMRVLKPQVDAINAKYPGDDQQMMMKRSQETMALYRNAGASPMSGCVPMLLQMPFLIALYMFFPTAVALRGESFLWAKDLSTYDGLIHWGTEIPLIGDHISLFCLLWCITNIFYSKYTMNAGGAADNPQMKSMKWMPYIMTIMFFFFFNNQSSGLTYYYFISTLITILQFVAARMIINEDKVLAKLEENKKKPKKKSGFMARLEKMQKEQEKMMREQQKNRARGK